MYRGYTVENNEKWTKNSEHVDSYYSPFYHLTSLCQLDMFSTTSRQARKLRRLDFGEDPDSSFNGMSLSLSIIIIYTYYKGRCPGVSTPKRSRRRSDSPSSRGMSLPSLSMSLQQLKLLPKNLGEDQPPPPPEAWLYCHCQSLSLQQKNSTKEISAKIRLLLLSRHVFTIQCLSSSSIPTTQRQDIMKSRRPSSNTNIYNNEQELPMRYQGIRSYSRKKQGGGHNTRKREWK